MTERKSAWRRTTTAMNVAPPAVVLLHPDGFADDYDLKPNAPVEIGIRLLSVDTLDAARSVAAKKAGRRHPDMGSSDPIWCEAFNEALMQWVVARATTQPGDVSQPYWSCAEDVVPFALSPAGLLRLWEEHEMLLIGSSALSPEIDQEGADAIANRLATGTLYEGLTVAHGRYVRRLLARVAEVAGIDVEEEKPAYGVRLT